MIYCEHCKTEFEREPLIVYNGEWYCPYCLGSLFPEPKISSNFENVRKFLESERLFHEGWLLGQDGKALKTALRLCREAAYAHNPYALIAMGYYHEKNYLNPFASESERVRSAYQYYKTVAAYDYRFRKFFCPQSVPPEAELKSGELEKLTSAAISNLYALVSETDAESVESVFRIAKETVMTKLREILNLKEPETEEISAEKARFPSAEEFLTEIRPDEVLFGFEKADARLLTELATFDGISNDKELNADNFLAKRNLTMWIMSKDKTWKETEAGNKNEFLKAAKSGAKQFVIAYWKNGIGKISHKRQKVSFSCSKEEFDRSRLKLVQNGKLYDFRVADLVIAAKILKERKETRREEMFGAVLEMLTEGGL